MSNVRTQPKLIIITYENFSFTEENILLLKKLRDLGYYLVIATDRANGERQKIAGFLIEHNIEFDFIYNWDDFDIDSTQQASKIIADFYDHIIKNISFNSSVNISKENTISFDDSFNEPGSPMLKAAMGLGYQKENLLTCNQLRSLLPPEPEQHPQSTPPKNKPSDRGWKVGGAMIGCIIGVIVAGIVGPDMGLNTGIQTFIWWTSLGAMGTVGGWFIGEELGKDANLMLRAEPLNDRQAAVPGMGCAAVALQLSSGAKPTQSQSDEKQHGLPLAAASRSVQIPSVSEASPWTHRRRTSSYDRSLLADRLAHQGHSPQPFNHSSEDPLVRRERISRSLGTRRDS